MGHRRSAWVTNNSWEDAASKIIESTNFGFVKIARVNLQVRLPGGRKVNVADVAADRYLEVNLKEGAAPEVVLKEVAPAPAEHQP